MERHTNGQREVEIEKVIGERLDRVTVPHTEREKERGREGEEE